MARSVAVVLSPEVLKLGRVSAGSLHMLTTVYSAGLVLHRSSPIALLS